ncbi:RNA methyltransferase [Luteibacter rhizovicinus DSM 16549]|uniref:tRNA (cytidine/uridine-2'-O-)-methyltransferase TrmJ n=1 Tax=Luteibacter rhizovicinus DSM 16549 TaxID=1440763 RepID=A0A0G9HER0_9GAMM|nr:RNA methyltransferase [Luteibacter rhizovicinus]APG04493.1 RNA methyltransferase [Luteibacter rhizovicinus DSM 16549]KLD67629.1 RNA methyltransferase [Luteibacter rhizovicinus DSM 16549]KLD75945.1 RNA methyltransferase [Xanthomonas hyacinthi DSM 19077]
MALSELNDRLRFVLVRTSHSGNIGSAARAMRTMGFDRLTLVAPQRFPDPEATALAAGADDVLAKASIQEDVVAGLAGTTFALGLSARRRGVNIPELDPREGVAQAIAAARRGEQVALVFGNERTGLENDELSRCHAMIRIPSVDDFSSLNLSQAVQVVAYELRSALLADEVTDAKSPEAVPDPDEVPADAEQLERFFTHLGQMLDDIEFHKGRSPVTIMLKLRKLFLRARPELRELRILHGILADAQRMAEIAHKKD